MIDSKEVLHLAGGAGLGGAQSVIRGIISKSQSAVFCLKKGKIERFTKVSNNVFFGTNSRFFICNPFIFLKIIDLIKDRKAKILHTHSNGSILYAIFIKKICPSLKIVYHEHGKILFDKKITFFLKIIKNSIDLFIAPSKTIKNKLTEKANINPKKISLLYNFVDLTKFNTKNITYAKRDKEKLGIRKNEFVIGFAGRLNKIKGCEYLIKALPYLNFPYKALIAGDGPLKRNLKKLTEKLNIKNKVLFLGYIENIANFYPLIDIYVMPSLSEASPVVFYEAQAFGIPIIGSDVVAINEFIIPNRNGLLFEVKNSRDLAKKINLIYKNEKLRSSMERFSKRNILKYSLDNYIKKLNKVYLNLR
jgi:glycosyltransferase involved in cell wall biosynthesis